MGDARLQRPKSGTISRKNRRFRINWSKWNLVIVLGCSTMGTMALLGFTYGYFNNFSKHRLLCPYRVTWRLALSLFCFWFSCVSGRLPSPIMTPIPPHVHVSVDSLSIFLIFNLSTDTVEQTITNALHLHIINAISNCADRERRNASNWHIHTLSIPYETPVKTKHEKHLTTWWVYFRGDRLDDTLIHIKHIIVYMCVCVCVCLVLALNQFHT